MYLGLQMPAGSSRLIQSLYLLPSFVLNLLVASDWIQFVMIISSNFSIASAVAEFSFFNGLTASVPWSLARNFKDFVVVLLVLTFIFAAFEKRQKERFVINYSNEKTRKILHHLFDSSECA